jgi:hypothetical protein
MAKKGCEIVLVKVAMAFRGRWFVNQTASETLGTT